LLLLITCTNVASLLLARAASRQPEIAVRFALGASQRTIVGQMLVEALILSLAGASIGLLVASGAIAVLRSTLGRFPRMDEIAVDGRILVYTAATAVLVSVYCGTFPALRFARRRSGDLKAGGRAVLSSRQALHWLLVGAQVSLSVTLLAGAGLLVRSFQELWRVDAGFDLTRVLTFRVSAGFAESADYDRLVARVDRAIEGVRALPGVDGVATSGWLPGVPQQFESAFTLTDGGSETTRGMVAARRVVSPEYFETMRIPLLLGDLCRRQPRGAAADVMVNSEFVRRYLAERPSPIGLHFAPVEAFSWPPGVIAGVVGNAREIGLDRDPVPTVYPCSSAPYPTPYFLVRTRGEPQSMASTIRARIHELEPLRSVYDIALLEDQIEGAFAQNRLRTTILVAFAATALSLACVGLYGMLSYVVSLRRKEIGLRLALGAARPGIVRQFVFQAIRVVLLACAGGVALSFVFARLLAGMLYGVSASDPLTLSTVVVIVLAVAILAALVPATRAARLEPMEVLRDG
jgi:putative ABC transport system permease protein